MFIKSLQQVAADDFFNSVVSVIVLLSDKIILIFIFVTGTLTADATSLGSAHPASLDFSFALLAFV
jgi:hypothetical protein